MSQEEEKLIEEFINKIREIYNVVEHLPGKSLAFEDYILHHLRDGMHEAYRSGKLAGFEMCEKLSKPFIQTLFNETENSSTKGLIMLGNCAKQTLSLIEEEKKKL